MEASAPEPRRIWRRIPFFINLATDLRVISAAETLVAPNVARPFLLCSRLYDDALSDESKRDSRFAIGG